MPAHDKMPAMRRVVLVVSLMILMPWAMACRTSPQAAEAPAAEAESATLEPDPPIDCCEEWNQPRAPFKVFGNTWFVGTQGLSSLLIATDDGLVLVDVALPQSAALIDANIRELGFRTADVKYILTSHAHFDHLGGVRAMQRFTGATVLASASTAEGLALGHPVPGDPQFGTGPFDVFPAVTDGVRVMQDRETFTLGGTTVTAHYTPGHTPGATTWTWQSCEAGRCLNMVYLDSLTAISHDGFRYTATPGLVESFRATLAHVRGLPCDIVIATHPAAAGLDGKLARRGDLEPGAPGDPFVDTSACEAIAARSLNALEERVAKEAASQP